MMRAIPPLCLLALATAARPQSVAIVPQVLHETEAQLKAQAPYKWTGLASARGYVGSGVVVAPKVFLTAGHLLFDHATLSWVVPHSELRFAPGHQGSQYLNTGNSASGEQLYVWTDYATRSAENMEVVDQFNLDLGAVTTTNDLLADGTFAPAFVDPDGKVSTLRQPRLKWVLGYPSETIPAENRGRMHAHDPGSYIVIHYDPDNSSFDTGGYWNSVHIVWDVLALGGSSGSPLFVQDDQDRWRVNALVVGGPINGNEDAFAVVRTLDEAAWHWVDVAASVSGAGLLQVLQSDVVETIHRVALHWTDRSENESGYLVERRGSDGFELLATLPADAIQFVDTSVEPGTTYQYRVSPEDRDGNRAPPSMPREVQVPGANRAIAAALNEPFLFFTTHGDAPMAVDPAGTVGSGRIYAMESSALRLQLVGPGELRFTWSISSEGNPDAGTPGHPDADDVFDAVFFYRDEEEVDFLSGIIGPVEKRIQIPPGPSTLEWVYWKDPYADEGDDRSYLHGLSWTPRRTGELTAGIVYGGYEVEPGTRRASWFGDYSAGFLPWSLHEELGWLYFSPFGETDLWAYSPAPGLGWLYLSPAHFPHLYSHTSGRWLHYLKGSGKRGHGLIFYDHARAAYEAFSTPNE